MGLTLSGYIMTSIQTLFLSKSLYSKNTLNISTNIKSNTNV